MRTDIFERSFEDLVDCSLKYISIKDRGEYLIELIGIITLYKIEAELMLKDKFEGVKNENTKHN